MRKTKLVKRQILDLITVDILCNKCGKSCNHSSKDSPAFEGIEELEVGFGYYSKFFGDMESIRFSICEKCLFEFVKTFKIPHEQKGGVSSDYLPLPKYNKLEDKREKDNHKEWIAEILKLSKEKNLKIHKKDLTKKTIKELSDLFYSIN